MVKRKLFEGEENNSPVFNRIKSLLIGAPCFGDDGEPAEVVDFYIYKGIPMIDILQDDGIEWHGFELAQYLDAIFDEGQDEREEIEDYLESLGLYESVNEGKKKLVLNEEAKPAKKNDNAVLILDAEDSDSVKNFILWVRELLKEVGIPVTDPKSEKIYIKDGNIYYQGPYMGFKPGKAKMLQARLQKYINRENFPTGLSISPEHGLFAAPLEISGVFQLR